jgi:DHA2 family multidrug resistance protein
MKAHYKGVTLILLNIALGLGTFIQILDTSIANVAVPYIAGGLAVSADQGTWVITSFAASNAIVLPLTGWLSDYFGRVRLYVYSVILFTIASILCALSTSLAMLVFFRVLQGAVAGSLIPLSQSLILLNNPPEQQGAALGFWAMVVVVAPVVGPILGGYLTYNYSWPWIFYINIPFGAFSAGVAWALLKDRESQIVRNPIDWTGLFLLSLGVACLQIMLDKGQDYDWFQSNAIVTLAVISGVSLCYFCVWNTFEKYPIVNFSFFRDRNFVIGTIATTIGYLLFFGSTVVIPLWLQTEQNYTALWAGIAVAPIGIMPVLFSSAVGKYMGSIDQRAMAALSFFIFSVSFLYQSSFTTDVDIGTIMFARFVQGAAIPLFFLPLVQIALADIPRDQYASASGVFNFFRILVGSGFGTSLSVYLWSRLQIFHHSRLTESTTLYDAPTVQFYDLLRKTGPQFTDGVIDRLLDQQIQQQAFMLSTNDLSWLAAALFFLMIPVPFFCRRVTGFNSTASGAH